MSNLFHKILFIFIISFLFFVFTSTTHASELEAFPEQKVKVEINKVHGFGAKPNKNGVWAEVIYKEKEEVVGTAVIEPGQINPVALGVNFLKENQNPDGSWSEHENLKIFETSAVLQFLRHDLDSEEIQAKTEEWFKFQFPENNHWLAEKIISLAWQGQDIGYLDDFLATQINDNGGFGYKKSYQSDAVTTARVLLALYNSNYQDVGLILGYLADAQNSDGGWPEIPGQESSIFATNLVLEVIKPYIALQDAASIALGLLKESQQSNGSWQDDLLLTALSYENLIINKQEPQFNQKAIDYILSYQDETGLFENSFYKTAKALEVLAKPDLGIISLENVSDLIPNEPTAIKAIIRNLGYISSVPINFGKEPSAFVVTIDGEALILQLEQVEDTVFLDPGKALEITFLIEGLSFGEHQVAFEVNYDYIEFSKNNNKIATDMIFDDPGFLGPAPPKWIGAAAGSEPGEIRIRWRLSEDSLAAGQAVYLSAKKGSYADDKPNFISENQVGTWFALNSEFYNMPIYIAVASLDANGVRGDYSMETWAIGYEDAESQRGSVVGQVIDNNKDIVSGAVVEFYTFGNVQTNDQGKYFANFYPGFYLVNASKASYVSDEKQVEIKPSQETVFDFKLQIIDDGAIPEPVIGLKAEPDDSEIRLYWDADNMPADFKHFNVYGSTRPISSVAFLEPITQSVTAEFTDTNIINGIDYYYAVSAEDKAGNFEVSVQSIGPVRGNSAPVLSNLSVQQDKDQDGLVIIDYNIKDAETEDINIALQYWDGANWQKAKIYSGAAWNAKSDFPGFDTNTKIKIIADDKEAVNNITVVESEEFALDTKSPANPELDEFEKITNKFKQVISGTKEPNSAIYINDTESIALDNSDSWEYELILQEGENKFEIIAYDEFANKSEQSDLTIILDTQLPDPVQNLITKTKAQKQYLAWDAYNDEHKDFAEFQVYFKKQPFNNIDELDPIVTSNDIHTTTLPTNNLVNRCNAKYYYIVTVKDTAGNLSLFKKKQFIRQCGGGGTALPLVKKPPSDESKKQQKARKKAKK